MTVFLILTYILLSVSIWVKGIEASERGYSEFYKESTVELAVSQITDEKIRNVSNRIMERSLFRLNNHSIYAPVKESGDGEVDNIRGAMAQLLINGSANSSYFTHGGGISAEDSSMNQWVESLNASLLSVGISIDEYSITHFNLSQSDYETLNYSFVMHLSMSDEGGKASVTRDYLIEDELSIVGFVDPAIARESAEKTSNRQIAYRMFFFPEDPKPVTSANKISGYSVHGGQGWFYGYLVPASSADSIDESIRHRFILVGDFKELESADPLQQFGAYIVTSAPEDGTSCNDFTNEEETFNPVRHSGELCDVESFDCGSGECTLKPFIEAEDFQISDAPDCPVFDPLIGDPGTTKECVMFTNPHSVEAVHDDKDLKLSGGSIYDIEDMRDHIMCGYYALSPEAPSYLQRLLSDSYDRSHEEYGIETFVIGKYANDESYSLDSRLDRELFSGQSGHGVRGMPGCKRLEHCTEEPITGIFTLTKETASDYGLNSIYCPNDGRCEQ